jgi:hypothetical protein
MYVYVAKMSHLGPRDPWEGEKRAHKERPRVPLSVLSLEVCPPYKDELHTAARASE